MQVSANSTHVRNLGLAARWASILGGVSIISYGMKKGSRAGKVAALMFGGDLVPDIRAAAAIIYNPETNEVLWEENSQSQRSIASITKVMTAVAFLETDPDLTQPITVVRGDVFRASTTYLRANDQITAEELLHLLLIASDNAAARVLARVSPYGTDGFIQRMNEKAVELGLESTSFTDPSGLNPANVSSAYDLSRLISFASANDTLAPIMRTAEYTARTSRRRVRRNHRWPLRGRGSRDLRQLPD